MTETWNPLNPILTNQVAADIPDIEENFDYLMAMHGYWVDSSETDQGAAGSGNSIKDLVDAIGSTKKAVLFLKHHAADGNTTTYTVTTSETITSNITVVCQPGARLDGAGTLTINGPFRAGAYQVFDSDFVVVFGNRSVEAVDPVWWGAVGDGATDDSTAIDSAFESLKAIGYADAGNEVGGSITTTLKFMPGDYNYAGSGLTLDDGDRESLSIIADPNTVRIRLAASIYFITITTEIDNTNISGIHFVGGYGGIRYSHATQNVSGTHQVTDCMFTDYTRCAIGNIATDMPHIHIERCIFRCLEGETAIGVALGGFADTSRINKCDFRKNKYHIKLGDRISGNVYITENDFINTGSQDRVADIWLVPNATDAGGTSSGQGTIIAHNKFGNEGMAVDDNRILVAKETSGTDRMDKQHSTDWVTDEYVSGIYIRDNHLVGVGSQTAAFIYSYVRNCNQWHVRDNHCQGGDHTYLVEFNGDLDDDQHNSLWDVRYTVGTNPNVRVMPFSNKAIGIVDDPFIQAGGDLAAYDAFPTIEDSVGFKVLLAMQDCDTDGDVTNATRAAETDAIGGARGAEITATASTGRWHSEYLVDPTPGTLAFLEFDLKKSAATAAVYVDVFIKHDDNALYLVRRRVKCPAAWKRFRIPFLPQTNDAAATKYKVNLQIYGYSAGVITLFKIGRVCVYHGFQAMNYGHVRTLGDGTYNGEHLILGAYHIWVDGTGDLRINSGAPSAHDDGAVVGAQS